MSNKVSTMIIENVFRQLPIILILILLSISALAGTKKEKVKASADVLLSNISHESARRMAFKQAESSALESVVKELSSVKILSVNETGDDFADLFRQNISSRTSGIILEEDTLADTIMTLDQPGNEFGLVYVYHVEIEALILIEDINKKSPYDIKITMLPGNRFTEGQEAQLIIDLKEKSYLHIFNITSDNKVLVLYPLSEKDIVPIETSESFIYPKNNFKLKLFPLPGHDMDQEEIRVVATKNPINFFASDLSNIAGTENFIDLKATDLLTLEMEILRIPYDERGQATVVYEVRSK